MYTPLSPVNISVLPLHPYQVGYPAFFVCYMNNLFGYKYIVIISASGSLRFAIHPNLCGSYASFSAAL